MSKIITSLKNMMGFEEDYIYEDEYYDEELNEMGNDYESFDDYKSLTKRNNPGEQDKVVNLHKNNVQVNIVKPMNFDEAPQICDDLKAQKILVHQPFQEVSLILHSNLPLHHKSSGYYPLKP